jgi:uncharacterized protein
MKRRIAVLLLFLGMAALLVPSVGRALSVPPLTAHINDYAHMISEPTARGLERQLAELEKTDSTQVVVLTIPGLEGESLEDFSIKVAEAWRIGSKGVDNGVILLIVRDDRKVRIEVGRGLEGKLTDLVSGHIIRNSIIPRFKAGDFDGGVRAGVGGIVEAVRGEYTAEGREPGQGHRRTTPIFTLLIFLFIALVFAGALSKVFGAAVGAAGLPIAAKLSFPALSYPILGGLAFLGLVIGLLIHVLFIGGGGGKGGKGGKGGGGGGGGFLGGLLTGLFLGGFGGGSSSGGDSSGGFFGGGGDFGGGGASGDW